MLKRIVRDEERTKREGSKAIHTLSKDKHLSPYDVQDSEFDTFWDGLGDHKSCVYHVCFEKGNEVIILSLITEITS